MARQTIGVYRKSGIVFHLLLGLVWSALALYMIYGAIFVIPGKMALAGDPPPAVSLTEFSRRTDVHAREEVNLIGRLESETGTVLTRGDETRQMFLLFAPDSAPDDTTVRALFLLDREDARLFAAQLAEMKAKAGTEGAVMIGGQRLVLPDFNREAEAELTARGLTLSDEYIYIKPLLQGRSDPSNTPLWAKALLPGLFVVAALVQLLVARFRMRHNARVRHAVATGQLGALIPAVQRRDLILGILAFIVLAAVFAADAYFRKGS